MLKKTSPARSGTSPGSGPQTPLDAARGAGLGDLVQRARWLDALDSRLRQCLPPDLARHCRLGNVRGDALVFLVSSPVWKSRLRLHAAVVLTAAHALEIPARELTIKVGTLPPVPVEPPPPPPLSDHARASLRATAASISDPGLRERLLALASVP